jgi:hypothetical protein
MPNDHSKSVCDLQIQKGVNFSAKSVLGLNILTSSSVTRCFGIKFDPNIGLKGPFYIRLFIQRNSTSKYWKFLKKNGQHLQEQAFVLRLSKA